MKALGTNYPLLSSISKKLQKIHRNNVSGIKETITVRKTIAKVKMKLDKWVEEGKHRDSYDSMDDLLNELEITSEELSFYCSKVLNKKFSTWRKDLRIEEAKELLIQEPETPVCHIGFAIGFNDKSNFRQQFRKTVGCTPTERRERNIKEYSDSKK